MQPARQMQLAERYRSTFANIGWHATSVCVCVCCACFFSWCYDSCALNHAGPGLVQAALKAFDDDHNGALDNDEFERFAKSLIKSGGLHCLSCVLHDSITAHQAGAGVKSKEGRTRCPTPPKGCAAASSACCRAAAGPDMFFARVGKDAMIKTALLPAVTVGVKKASGDIPG